ncbi:hypothetical protein HK097_005805, partial [Rhizophlyctis rosea]
MSTKEHHHAGFQIHLQTSRDRALQEQVAKLMFGAGDVPTPSADSVSLMSEMLLQYWDHLEFLKRVWLQASQVLHELHTATPARARLRVSDFLHALEGDPKKYARAQDLMELQKELVEHRRMDLSRFGGSPGKE